MKKKNIESSLDSLLKKDGIYEEVSAGAIKRVLARQVEAAMKEKHFSKRRWRARCTPAVPYWTACSIRITKPSP
jgi:antitoxin HicB